MWSKEFREPVEPVSLPATLDGMNCRGALRLAQKKDPMLERVRQQLGASLESSCAGVDRQPGMMKAKELEGYRLGPLDDVLERKVFLADAMYWVPVMPDDCVTCRNRTRLGVAGLLSCPTRLS